MQPKSSEVPVVDFDEAQCRAHTCLVTVRFGQVASLPHPLGVPDVIDHSKTEAALARRRKRRPVGMAPTVLSAGSLGAIGMRLSRKSLTGSPTEDGHRRSGIRVRFPNRLPHRTPDSTAALR